MLIYLKRSKTGRGKEYETQRAKDNPREGGYDYNDPWYDERHSTFSIIDNPRDGSRLDRFDVIEARGALESIGKGECQYVSTSIFILFGKKIVMVL